MGHRFMYRNLIDDETAITATSVETGFVGAGVPRVTNAGGSMIFSGAYAGDDREVYSVEIETPGDVGTLVSSGARPRNRRVAGKPRTSPPR